ncbi:acyl-CoA dehydrogenase family protein [Paenibacillus sp. WLX2291]|uniref:acyl-CoA dehydrogenase family protein n=1 Tax=Paenibacillus sp. WLX2291 TaxID=3296934 RepID=UPI00398450F2
MTLMSNDTKLNYTEKQLLQNATDLIPFLQSYARQIDQERHIPDEVITKLSDAGLFKLGTRKIYGGHEVSIRAMVEIISEVAKGNGSVGWVVQIINGNNYNATLSLSEPILDSIFGQHEEVRFCSVLQPRKAKIQQTDDGYLIEEGLWGFASGSKHATHALLNINDLNSRTDQQQPGMILAVIPMNQIEIVDDWYTISLKGSASNSLKLHDVFVPNEYIANTTLSGIEMSQQPTDSMNRYRPYAQVITTITTGISAILGLARAAVDCFVQKAPTRGITMTVHPSQAAVGHIQYHVGLAAMKVESAHLHINRTIDNLEDHVQTHRPFTVQEFAQIQTDIAYASKLCWEAVDLLVAESGGSFIAESNRLSEIFRDIRGGANHALTTASTGLELYGRILMGQAPQQIMTLGIAAQLHELVPAGNHNE